MRDAEDQITAQEIQEHFEDRWWRLNHLYYVVDENGDKVLFKPESREAQRILHEELWFFNIVPKARQLGVTTFFAILYLDQILFSENKTAVIIAHRQEDMKKIFKNKIRFAFDNLHPWLKQKIGEPNTDNANELVFSNGGSISVSMTTRSGTVQFLHISEFGYICQKFPERAEEIVTGAINSVHPGNMVSIESTAMGKEGYFYKFSMDADRMQKENRTLTELDFKLFFFPWWMEPRYNMDKANFIIDKQSKDYFNMLKLKHGIELTDGQKRWYIKKKQTQGAKMFAEYPSILEEAFSVPIEGSYYKVEMERVFLDNRIRSLPHNKTLEVDTYWDLGMNDFNVILFVQTDGKKINFIDMYYNQGEGLDHYFQILADKRDKLGYRYGVHWLPHDVEVRELGTGISRKNYLYKLGMRNIRVGRKLDPQDGIESVRRLFSHFYFDEEKCKKLHESLFNYRKDYDKKLGVFKNKPRHDDNSHFADAVRLLAQGWVEPSPIYEREVVEAEQAFFG